MYTTALSQIAFFPYQATPLLPDTASVMTGELSNRLYQARERSKSSSSRRKPAIPS